MTFQSETVVRANTLEKFLTFCSMYSPEFSCVEIKETSSPDIFLVRFYGKAGN